MCKNRNYMQSTLRLFGGVDVDRFGGNNKHSHRDLKHMIENGYIVDESIKFSHDMKLSIDLVYGMNSKQANSALHKSFDKVANASILQLVTEQLLHYMTTYGFESLGIYNDYVYIPVEELDIPDINEDKIKLRYIHALSSSDIYDRLKNLVGGVALSEQTLDDIMCVVKNNKGFESLLEHVQNRELLCRMHDYFGTLPNTPVEQLRYMVFKLTGQTLLIKSEELIEALKCADSLTIDELLGRESLDVIGLASIFFRYKPLFLAMKHASFNKHFFNRLRKRANIHHKPMPKDYLNCVTENISHNNLNLNELKKNLEDVNIFRKIRLANALKMRNSTSSLYLIRNGKAWVNERQPWNKTQSNLANKALRKIYRSIVDSLRPYVGGVNFYVPEGVHYVLPSTEKQFVGNIPNGTSFDIAKDAIFGVHWFNTEQRRVDLDLSLLGVDCKFGWDASYRKDTDILFSGDVTTARPPNGASEFFRLTSKGVQQPFLICLNDYNRFPNVDASIIPFTIMIGNASHLKSKRIVDLNKVDVKINSSLDTKNNVLGVVHNNKFVISQSSVGGKRTASHNETARLTRDFLFSSAYHGGVDLINAFKDAGGNVLHEVPDDEEYVDLSPSSIDKTTILQFLRG